MIQGFSENNADYIYIYKEKNVSNSNVVTVALCFNTGFFEAEQTGMETTDGWLL